MPLHDWSKLLEWSGVHQLWIGELFRDIKKKLPPGYRAGLATIPSMTIGGPSTHPDVSVRENPNPLSNAATEMAADDDSEFDAAVTLLALEPSAQVRVFHGGDLAAVVELISPRNKDCASAQKTTVDRLVGYMALGVNVLFVDVHALPRNFSVADEIALALDYEQPPCPSPNAVAYRVGNADDGRGRSLATRKIPLVINQPLPSIPLPLSQTKHVSVDLETTYNTATSDYMNWPPLVNGTDGNSG
jgi:Protein of unknown function (DUF4058)